MTFVEAIKSGFSNYANFSGRSPRSALWWWILFQCLVMLATIAIDLALFGLQTSTPVTSLAGLALCLPGWAVGVRRLHDIGRSGWWWLIGLIPIVGWIILIVWYCKPGEPGTNQYDRPDTMMTFGDAVRSGWNNYATFSGRTPRAGYWWWIVFVVLVGSGVNTIDVSAFGQDKLYLTGIFWLAALIPNLSVATRRLHDIDRRGWWQLLWFIPVIGWIILLVWYCKPSQPGANRFGPNPYGM
jgi:uncharacterized membrane protein YhaH (DUF805 family)